MENQENNKENNKSIAPQEAFALHELLTFKNTCLTKSAAMSILVGDEKLKSILQQDVNMTQIQIRELKSFLEQSDMMM